MKEILIGGVSATVLGEDRPHGRNEVMLALLVHGRTRSKEDSLKFSSILLKAVPHLVCVSWDLPNHGSRTTDPVANGSWDEGNPLHMLQMQAIIDQGSAEAIDLLQMVHIHLPPLNITKRVMIGVSLGGYISWNVASNHTNLLTAAIPIIASPDFLAVMRERWVEYEKTHSVTASRIKAIAFDDGVVARMKLESLKVNALRSSSLPILAICGADDDFVPAKYSIKWGRHALPHQRVEVVPGVKHEVPREIIDLTVEYLISIMTRL